MKLSRRQFMGLDELNRERFETNIKWDDLVNDGKITFAAINDLHVLDAGSTAIVNRAVQQINETEKLAFTVVLGDIATSGRLPELCLARMSLDKLKRPGLWVPGNHDLPGGAAEDYLNYDRVFEMRQWAEKNDGWVFLGIDTCNGTKSNVTVPRERMDWIRKQLEGVKAQSPIALFSHHPFNPNTKAYRVENAEEVLGLFRNHHLKMVVSGHYHGNQVEERDGVLFVTTACCTSTRTNFDGTKAKGYRLFHLDQEHIEHEFVEVPA
jgi:3',5'-cyclic AMP phosphodiesterase CpdA